MALKKERKTKKVEKNNEFRPFDKENVVRPLKLFVSIVPYGQADGIIKLLEQTGVTFNFVTSGEGTGKNFLPVFLLGTDDKKQIVFSLVREDESNTVCEVLRARFSTSKTASGLALSIKLTSVAGVSVYRFLTNTRKVKKVINDDEF